MPLPNLPFYKQSDQMNVLSITTPSSIKLNTGYFRIRFVDMRLARDFVGTKTFVPALHGIFGMEWSGKGPYEVVISPEEVKIAKGADRRRIYIAPQVLTPIIPFDGRRIETLLGLFAVPDKDLAFEMLNFLGAIAGPLQRPDLIAALGIASKLREAIDALLSLNDAKMLLGWHGEFGNTNELNQQCLIVTPPDFPLEKDCVKIIGGRLVVDGKSLDFTNYMVFAIEVANKRSDWRNLPEIKQFFDEWNRVRSLYKPSVEEYNESVSRLLTALRNSPNIIAIDAERIAREEILPLLREGKSVQSTLFREAGFDLEALKSATDENNLLDFQEITIN